MSLPTRTALDPAVLAEIVRQIVEIAEPERIIVFSSAARGGDGAAQRRGPAGG